MTSEINDALVHTWVTGWARTHGFETRLEGNILSARVSTDADEWEYVMHAPSENDLRQATEAIKKSPTRVLSVIAAPGSDVLSSPVDGLELLSDDEKLMVVDMGTQDVEDPITPEGFATQREDFDGWTLLTVTHGEQVAARGRLAIVDDFCVLDRIYTANEYRRQGLGTFVTRALLAFAHVHDVAEGILVAGGAGQELYEYLGWSRLADVHVYGIRDENTATRPHHSQLDDDLNL